MTSLLLLVTKLWFLQPKDQSKLNITLWHSTMLLMGEWCVSMLQAPHRSVLCAAKTWFKSVWQPQLKSSQVKAPRRKETTSHFSLWSKGPWFGLGHFVNEDTSWWCIVTKFTCRVLTHILSWPWKVLFLEWKFWRYFICGIAAAMHALSYFL